MIKNDMDKSSERSKLLKLTVGEIKILHRVWMNQPVVDMVNTVLKESAGSDGFWKMF